MAQMQQKLEDGNVVKAGNNFAFNLYRILKRENEGVNMFFSPYSITSAMSMVLLGSRGDTAKELLKGLGYDGLNSDAIHDGNRAIRESIDQLSQGVTLETANRLFSEKTYKLLDDFLGNSKKFYGSEVSPLDFVKDPDGSRKFINDWVAEQTKHKIEDLIPGGAISPITRLVLANAIYFKGNWDSKFYRYNTRGGDFHVASDKTLEVDMMTKKAKYSFAQDTNLKVKLLEIPYEGYTTSMVIILPDERFGLGEVEENLDFDKMKKLEGQCFHQEVVVHLPKFRMEFSSELVKTFQTLGVKSIFNVDSADCSGMSGSKDLYVSSIVHKAFVEVNEEGTEAAAATAVLMGTRMRPPPPPEFICDHPFLFIIKHKPTNAILFVGRYSNP